MRCLHLSSAVFFAFAASFPCLSPVGAGEKMGYPPPDPSGTVRPKMTAATIQNELDQRLKSRFTASADSSGKLTAQQARDAGWGFIADHFDEIAKSNGNSVSLDEIKTFMAARSPLPASPTPKANGKSEPADTLQPLDTTPIQIVE
jgi:hypothetical protein